MDETQRDQIRTITSHARRIVVKIGTNLIDSGFARFNRSAIVDLAGQMAELMQAGREVILVSSGAVGSGVRAMDRDKPARTLPERQAYAAIGQGRLMHHYQEFFAERKIIVSQMLLTRSDLEDRRRYVNARNTLDTLLGWGVLPIINENDTVSVEELRFGDNDMLSAAIAAKAGADLLVMLTDVQGLSTRPPSEDPDAELVEVVEQVTGEIRSMAGKPASAFSLGGMRSKVDAADVATRAGTLAVVAGGREPQILHRLLAVDVPATWFLPQQHKVTGRKRWLLSKRDFGGWIRVDAGAAAALVERGKSLLASGVVQVEGTFKEGQLIEVFSPDKEVIARGLTHYASEDLSRIKGLNTAEIKQILPGKKQYAVIHRDDLVLV